MSITRNKLGFAGAVAALIAVAPSIVAQADEGRDGPRLEGRAVLPVDTFAVGPPAGANFTPNNPNGFTFPLPSQPVEGFSGIVDGRSPGEYLAITDNGFGNQANSGDFLIRAGFTLACVIVLQTVVLSVYLAVREPGQLMATVRAWRAALWVGLSGMAASAGWFTAMTIEPVAHVRALGQIELVFTFIAAHFFFKERSTRLEIGGILLVVGGILILLLATD